MSSNKWLTISEFQGLTPNLIDNYYNSILCNIPGFVYNKNKFIYNKNAGKGDKHIWFQ